MVNKGEYKPAWSRQAALKKKYRYDQVPDLKEIAAIISSIRFGKVDSGFQTMRARALFAMYYLTACRLSEVTKCNTLRKQQVIKKERMTRLGKRVTYMLDKEGNAIVDKWKEPHDYIGISKRDIRFELIDGKKSMLIITENRKNKTTKVKRLPIPVELEWEIASYVRRYVKKLSNNAILFDFGAKRATQIINETTGFNPHFIRHIRATHLVTKYDFNEQTLIKFMGWSDGRPAKHYMELKSTDLFRQFYKQ